MPAAPERLARDLHGATHRSGTWPAVGVAVRFVKPHGALYNAMGRDGELTRTVVSVVRAVDEDLVLLVQAGTVAVDAARRGAVVATEAFADRAYPGDGSLAPRGDPGAVIDDSDAVVTPCGAARHRGNGACPRRDVALPHPSSICVHGDTPDAAHLARAVRTAYWRGHRDRPFRPVTARRLRRHRPGGGRRHAPRRPPAGCRAHPTFCHRLRAVGRGGGRRGGDRHRDGHRRPGARPISTPWPEAAAMEAAAMQAGAAGSSEGADGMLDVGAQATVGPVGNRSAPVEIPVVFDGPDLQAVAGVAGVGTDAGGRHAPDARLTVAMIGFAPGFAYLAGAYPRPSPRSPGGTRRGRRCRPGPSPSPAGSPPSTPPALRGMAARGPHRSDAVPDGTGALRTAESGDRVRFTPSPDGLVERAGGDGSPPGRTPGR